MTLTKKELANAAGYTYRRLYDIDKSLPEDKKLFVEGKDGKCDLAMFIQRWVEFNVSKDDTDGMSLDEIKAQHEAVKMRKTELVVAQMEANLVDVNEVKLLWANIANTVMQNLVKLPQKIAVQVVGMQVTERIAGVIDTEIRNVLNALSDVPLPVTEEKPPAEKEEDGE